MSVYTGKQTGALLEARHEHCRQEARRLLRQLMVEEPDEIDLMAVVGLLGNLTVEEGGLDGSDGRILWGESGAVIRVKAELSPGRRRFTLGHEIGHYVLHKANAQGRFDTGHQLAIWNDASEETEANVFAAELLMPDFLYTPRLKRHTPSFQHLDELADDFATSRLAAALQYVHYCHEQVALVFSRRGQVVWSKAARSFTWRIRQGAVSGDSGAGELAAGKPSESGRMLPTPVCAWLTAFEYDREHDIMEESRVVGAYDGILSLLWARDDLED